MVPGGQQRADVAVEDEVGLDRPLDRLLDIGVGRVHEVADLAADVALPVGQRVEVGVDPGVLQVRQSTVVLPSLAQPSISEERT